MKLKMDNKYIKQIKKEKSKEKKATIKRINDYMKQINEAIKLYRKHG